MGVMLEPEQIDACREYVRLLLEWNRWTNLTSLDEPSAMAMKHFVDSLSVLPHGLLSPTDRVIDVGTGAGFPGLVLKILLPQLRLTLLDSVKKRVEFLHAVVELLGLSGVECIHGRAEDLGRKPGYRESFDVAVARAVARWPVLVEYLLPFVRIGGLAIGWKGPAATEEMDAAATAVQTLGGGETGMIRFSLPEGWGERAFLWVRKARATPPQYPRKAGVPARRPL